MDESRPFAPGIQAIDDIATCAGVPSLEGTFGPLLRAERGASHFIDMPAGLYLEEHAHATESLIFTVKGEWVLCSSGQRRHMRAGSLFWFGDGVSTGYEVPFDEDAFILIFKTTPRDSDDEFVTYLEGMAARIEEEHREGTPFRLDELQYDHPARVFARGIAGRSP